jgi:hypothetical protein
MKHAYLIVLVAVVLGLGLAVLSIPTVLANDNDREGPKVFAPNENIQGMSYGDWSAAWWQYALTFTNDVSPIMDTTGQYCNAGQGGPVFFLAGAGSGSATRTCTIPAGKALFVPIINFECSTVEPGNFHADNAQQARVCATWWGDGVGIDTLKFTIDGKKVMGLGNFRVQSPFYDFIVPPYNNFLGVDGVTSGSSASDGYWVMVKPLSPGAHVIHFQGAVVSGPGAGGSQNVTYNLTVTP